MGEEIGLEEESIGSVVDFSFFFFKQKTAYEISCSLVGSEFFFFKQKTAYEMTSSLVGSVQCWFGEEAS